MFGCNFGFVSCFPSHTLACLLHYFQLKQSVEIGNKICQVLALWKMINFWLLTALSNKHADSLEFNSWLKSKGWAKQLLLELSASAPWTDYENH